MRQVVLLEKASSGEIKDFYNSFHLRNVECPDEESRKKIRISIITVTYNSSVTIGDTLKSVQNQDYPNIEHILIDGGSSDNTVDIIKSYHHVSKYVSEKDRGIYDAMNKGIQLASGDIIGILNSDDTYAHNMVLTKVVRRFESENSQALYGDLNYVCAGDMTKVYRKWRSGSFKRRKFYYGWMPPHPTFFVKREVYENVGLFNTLLKRSADYEMMLRILYKYQYHAVYLREVLVKMRSGGNSNGSLEKRLEANKEDKLAWKVNGLKPHFFTLHLKPLRKILQFINKNKIENFLFNT